MRYSAKERAISWPSKLSRILAVFLPGAFLLALPDAAGGQFSHGLAFQKSCETPKNRCATNSDCPADQCCTTTADQNQLDCQIRVTNVDDFGDTWQINEAFDVVNPGTGGETRVPASGNLPIVDVEGAVLCSSGQTLPCILAAGASITFQSSGYVIRPSDPNPLPDEARISAEDLCNADGTQNCSRAVSNLSVFNATEIVSGCVSSGCPPTPTPTISPTPTVPPTVTPTPTATSPGPPNTPGPPVLPKTATRTPKPTKTPKP